MCKTFEAYVALKHKTCDFNPSNSLPSVSKYKGIVRLG